MRASPYWHTKTKTGLPRITFALGNGDAGLPRTTFAPRKSGAGFTLVELLVSLAIMTIITLIVTTGRAQYENSILLTNLSYDVALAIREAQVYGVDVRETGAGTRSFNTGYGVHFNTAAPTTFTLFADKAESDGTSDHFYNGNTSGEKVRDYTIKYGNSISAVCVVKSAIPNVCNPISGGILDITFHRPDPDACFTTGTSVSDPTSDTRISTCVTTTGNDEAQIKVQAKNGNVRCVRVFTQGQIQITSTCL